MNLHFKKAQSVLEYTLILGVVITIIIVVLFAGIGGAPSVRDSIGKAYEKTGVAIESAAGDLVHGVYAPSS